MEVSRLRVWDKLNHRMWFSEIFMFYVRSQMKPRMGLKPPIVNNIRLKYTLARVSDKPTRSVEVRPF